MESQVNKLRETVSASYSKATGLISGFEVGYSAWGITWLSSIRTLTYWHSAPDLQCVATILADVCSNLLFSNHPKFRQYHIQSINNIYYYLAGFTIIFIMTVKHNYLFINLLFLLINRMSLWLHVSVNVWPSSGL